MCVCMYVCMYKCVFVHVCVRPDVTHMKNGCHYRVSKLIPCIFLYVR